ncbi:MAG: VanW family protein [Lachnospiraceae bacterium]|nr:VanW family protein [Lachnospiraceae bacterium]
MTLKKYGSGMLLVIGLLLLLPDITVSAAGTTILSGVMIEDVDVSGMTRDEALRALETYEEELGGESLTLQIGGNELEAELSSFGVTYSNEDVVDEALGLGRTGNIVKRYKDQKDLQYSGKQYTLSRTADEDMVRTYVEENCTQFDQEAQNASLTRENGSFTFVAGTEGLELDVDAAVSGIIDYLENSWTSGENVLELSVVVTEPEGSADDLAYVQDLLGTYTTSFSTSSSDRCKNLESGAAHIDGTVLYPGEEFSTYETVAPFTEENGYAMAGSYLNGEVVDSMGGGICQVSSTLYNAVLRAELEVTERSPHSMTVHYVDLSEDAAIAGTYKDFIFVNDTDYPIYIEAYTTSDKKITFNIYGKETRDSNRTIEFESVTVSTTEPTTVLVDDASQGLGYKSVSSGSTGYVAELYKIVYVDGVETERIRVNKSTYQATNRTVTYGTAGDATISENLRAAIALQDEALADANIADIVAANAAAAAAAAAQ